MAPGLYPDGGPPDRAHHPGAGPPGPPAQRRRPGGHPGRGGPGAHGPHGHPLRPLGERRGRPAHRHPQDQRAEALLRPVPGKVQQQDQRRHLPPLAGSLRPRPVPLDHPADRGRLDPRRRRAGKTAALRRRPGEPVQPAGGQAAQQTQAPGPAAPAPGGGGGRKLHLRHPGQAPARVQAPADERPVGHLQILPDQGRQQAGPAHHGAVRRQGRPGLHHGQEHHPPDPLPAGPDRVRPRRPPLAARGDGRELQRQLGRGADPRLRHFGADLPGFQGGQRHQQHEVHGQRRRDPGHHGRRQRGDRRAGGPGQHLHLRRFQQRSHRPLRPRRLPPPGLLPPPRHRVPGGLPAHPADAVHRRPGHALGPVERHEVQGLVHGPAGRGELYRREGARPGRLRGPQCLGPEDAGEHRQIRLLLLRPHHRPVRRRHLAPAPRRPR